MTAGGAVGPATAPRRCQATAADARACAKSSGAGGNYGSRHAPRPTSAPGGPCGGGEGAGRPGVQRAAAGRSVRPPWRSPAAPHSHRRTWIPTTASGSTVTSSAPTSWRECSVGAGPGSPGGVRSGPFRSSHPFVPPSRGRVAFITGGGSGIGFRIAEIFMRYGAARAGPCEGSAGRSHRPSVAGTAVGPPSPAGTNSAWPR